MAQLCFVLACVLWTGRFGLGDGQGDGTQLEGNRGSFVCQQRCADLDGEGVREIRDETLFAGNHMGSCICQQSCSGQAETKLEQVNANLLALDERMEGMMQEMASSFEIKMAASTNKVERLQQTVDQLTQRIITEDRMEAMLRSTEDQMKAKLQRRSSSVDVKMAAMTNKVEGLKQTVDQLTQRTITEDRMEAMLLEMASSIKMEMAATTNTVDSLQQTVTQPTQSQLRITCPADFVFNLQANICFKSYTNYKTRDDASTFCQNLPGLNTRLVVLDTEEKFRLVQEHVSAHYSASYRYVWIGGRREDNEGRWLWETGQEVTGPWGPGRPDNAGGNQDCLIIYRFPSLSLWLLYDWSCSNSQPYICEY